MRRRRPRLVFEYGAVAVALDGAGRYRLAADRHERRRLVHRGGRGPLVGKEDVIRGSGK
jgi:hypothetical protein